MSKNLKTDLAVLEAILDTYGSERSRWPSAMRADLEHLIEKTDAAKLLDREAQALERVLGASPSLPVTDALKSRIMAAIASDVERPAKVIPLQVNRSTGVQAGGANRMKTYWSAAAMAASFAVGLYLGIAGLGSQTFEGAVQVSGLLSGSGDTESAFWLDFNAGLPTEDTL